MKWIAKNGIREEGTEFQSCDFSFNSSRTALLGLVDQHLASFEASVQCMIPFFCNKFVFISESRVRRVLGIGVGKAISYSDTFKIQLHVSCGGLEVVRNSGNVMPSVRFASNVEITANVRGILFEKASEEDCHIFCDFIF